MDIANGRRLRERVKVAVVLQIFLGIRKPLTTNFLLTQPIGADGRAHRSVNNDNAFLDRFEQQLRVRTVRCGLVHVGKLDHGA